MRLEELLQVLDAYTTIEVCNASGDTLFVGLPAQVKLADRQKKILSLVPQSNSKEAYIEVVVY